MQNTRQKIQLIRKVKIYESKSRVRFVTCKDKSKSKIAKGQIRLEYAIKQDKNQSKNSISHNQR